MKSQIRLAAMIVTAVLAASLAPTTASSPAAAQEPPPPPPPQSPPPSSEQSEPVAGCGVMHLGTIGPEYGIFVDSADGPCPSGNQTYPHTGVFEFDLTSEYEVVISMETRQDDDRYLSLTDSRGQVLALGDGMVPRWWSTHSYIDMTHSYIDMTLAAGTYRIEAASLKSSSPYHRYPAGGNGFLLGIYVFATNDPNNDDDPRSPDSDADAGRAIAPPPLPQPVAERTDCDKPSGDKYERRRDGNRWLGEHRVFALQTFTTIDGARVTVDTKGGEVQHDHVNLSQEGCSWIAFGAKANKETEVTGNALVKGHAEILNRATVSGNAQVYGDARVKDDAQISGSAQVYGNARVKDDAQISGSAQVYGHAEVYDHAEVYGNARVTGEARVYGRADVTGRVSCTRNGLTYPYTGASCRRDERKLEPVVTGNAQVHGDANVSGSARIVGNAKVYGDAEVTGTALIFGDMEIDSGVYDGTQEYKRIAEELYRGFYNKLRSELQQDCPKTISERDLNSLTIHLMKSEREIGTVDEALNQGCAQTKVYRKVLEDLSVSGWELFLGFGLSIAQASKLKRLSQIADLLELAMLVHDAHEVGERVATVKTLKEWGISEAEFKSYNDRVRVEYNEILDASG